MIELERLLASGGTQQRHRPSAAASCNRCRSAIPASPCTSKPVVAYCVVKASWNWASTPLEKRMTPITPSSRPLATHAAVRGHGARRFRLVVEDEAQRVGVMDRDVEDDAAACVRAARCASPADAAADRRQWKTRANSGLPMRPSLDRVAHRAMRRGVAEMMIGPHDDAALAAFRDHRAGIGQRQRERLLAHHMLSGRRGGKHLIAMQFVGGRDINGIDVLDFDQRFQARRRMRDSMLFGVSSPRDPRSCS